MTGIKDYSTTPSSNTAYFPENMDPADVNNNMRQVQADIREWYETEFRDLGHTPTYASTTSFTIAGDVTDIYVANRRVEMYGTTMGTFFGSIASSSYSSPNTTVNMTMDSGSLTANLSRVRVGINPTNNPVPVGAVEGAISAADNVSFSGNNTFSGTSGFSGNVTMSANASFTGKVIFPKKSELTIDTGEITVTGTNHDVGAESAASSDNLHTINGGSDGMFATLTPRNNSETIVVQHDVGNIVTPDGFDIELDSTAKSMLVQFDGGLNKWLVIAKPVSPIVNQRFIAGMELSKDTDDDHDMLIKAGQCANEGATEYLTLASDLTKQIDATWAEGDDAGGMFTGSVGNSTTYYIWLIKKTADGTVDAGYDTSSTGANAPSGWTAERLLGLVRTDSSANLDDIVHYRQDYKLFESGYKAISTSSQTNYAHLLGKEPDHLWGKMLCTSDNIGWTAGEVCYVSLPHWGYTSAIGINVQIDATNLTVRINSAVPMFIKTSYSTNTITAGSWNIKYYARVSY